MPAPRYGSLSSALKAPRDWRAFAAWAVVDVVVVAAITVAHELSPEFRLAVRDIGTVASSHLEGVPLYTGWLVFAGAVLWFAAATLGVVTGRVTRRAPELRDVASMMFWFGLLMLLLGADDLFRLHDGIFLKVGIKESVTLLIWGVLAVAWGLWHLPQILRDRDMPIFALGVATFALSILAEAVEDSGVHLPVNEEAAKFGGVMLFAVWAWRVAARYLDPHVGSRAGGPARHAG